MLETYPLHLLENLSLPGSLSSTWQGRQHRRTSGSEKNPLVQTRKIKINHRFNRQIILLITIHPRCNFVAFATNYKCQLNVYPFVITNMYAFKLWQTYSHPVSVRGIKVWYAFLIFEFVLYRCVSCISDVIH